MLVDGATCAGEARIKDLCLLATTMLRSRTANLRLSSSDLCWERNFHSDWGADGTSLLLALMRARSFEMLLHRMMGDADPCLHDCCARKATRRVR
jgi:hypothetical protein